MKITSDKYGQVSAYVITSDDDQTVILPDSDDHQSVGVDSKIIVLGMIAEELAQNTKAIQRLCDILESKSKGEN